MRVQEARHATFQPPCRTLDRKIARHAVEIADGEIRAKKKQDD